MNNSTFLVIAYLVIWGGIFVYLMYMGNQQRKLAGRVKDLETTLIAKEAR
jgi:CcmD family protein